MTDHQTPRPKPKILIIDDERFNINALFGLLNDDYQVMVAPSGEMGLKIALSGRPDLILLDIVMPEMDGYEVLERLKSDPLTQEIPVIFITGRSDASDESYGLNLGAADYISKPFHFAVVRARVDTQIRLKRQTDLLAEYAFRDGLTGLANRRRFDDYLQTEWSRCVQTGHDLALIILDVDHFKLYNDHYGHSQGDECLKRVAEALKSVERSGPLLAARYGGEEFVIVVPQAGREEARELAEEIRRSVERASLPHERSLTSDVVTVSVGAISLSPSIQGSPQRALEAADQRLYRSKSEGRNRATVERLESL